MSSLDIVQKLNSAHSVSEAFFKNCDEGASLPLLRIASTEYVLTRGEVKKRVEAVARFLQQQGVSVGTKVAVVSNTRVEWIIADLAILSLGGVTVSVYQSLPAAEVGFILWDSGAEIVFAENLEQVEKIKFLHGNEVPCPHFEGKGEQKSFSVKIKEVVTFESVQGYKSIRQIIEANSSDSIFEYAKLSRDTIASLVYTSGTTGAPKGVVQTHGNHLANVRQAIEGELVDTASSIFLMLPLAHSFARLMAYISLCSGVVLSLPRVASTENSKQDPAMTLHDMAKSGAEIIPLVPRIFEKIKERIEAKAAGKSLSAKIMRWLLPKNGKSGMFTRFLGHMIRKTIFGDSFRYALSGGAKLDPEVNRFFDALGIEVLEGYGLTETCVATNCNKVGRKKIGTVGPVLTNDIEVKIADDGEILFRGPNVTKGYWKRPIATKDSWDSEGWFHTGDLGSIDPDGALRITGRKKELIITANGKKIVPEGIEFQLKASPLISNAMISGDGKPYCVALVTLQVGVVEAHYGKGDTERVAVLETIQKHLDCVNAGLANFEAIKKFKIIEGDFTIENGLLTPTLKLKRNEVVKRFKAELEELYKN